MVANQASIPVTGAGEATPKRVSSMLLNLCGVRGPGLSAASDGRVERRSGPTRIGGVRNEELRGHSAIRSLGAGNVDRQPGHVDTERLSSEAGRQQCRLASSAADIEEPADQ